MHSVLIVEDDPVQLNILRDVIVRHYGNWNIVTASSYKEGYKALMDSVRMNDYFSLFLLDIQLSSDAGDRGGFVLAKDIRDIKEYYQTPLLFLTSVSAEVQHALSTYHCYNYISKPYTPEDIIFQLQQMLFTGVMKDKKIIITDASHISHNININDICYVTSNGHILKYKLTHGIIESRTYTLSKLLHILGDGFLQCHKTTIFNTKYFVSFDKCCQVIKINDTTLNVGRKYINSISELIDKGDFE